MLMNKLLSHAALKKVGACALVCAMLATTAVPAFAAETETTVPSEENPTQVYNIVDEAKAPKQLNVHVGNDAATEVNVTYTTVADTSTVISLQKATGGETLYFEGTSYHN